MKKLTAILFALVLLVICACTPPLPATNVTENTAIPDQQTDQNVDQSQNTDNDQTADQSVPVEEATAVQIYCGENNLQITLADTVSAVAFAEKLQNGDITIKMHGYGDFEMVGGLGFSLERDDQQMTTTVGDVILYSGNQIVIFYGSNSWAYTKIGTINGATRDGLLAFFGGTAEVSVTFSLH